MKMFKLKKICFLTLRHTCVWYQNQLKYLGYRKPPFLQPTFIQVQDVSHLLLGLFIICYLSNIRTSASHVVLLQMRGILGQEKMVTNSFCCFTTFESDWHFFYDPYISKYNICPNKLLRVIIRWIKLPKL